MAMPLNDPEDDGLLSEINMVPLIDVMLVLLIVFMVTLPVMQHAVPVKLPQANAQPMQAPPQAVRLAVLADGGYRWNDDALDEAQLQQRLLELGALVEQPPLHLLADRDVRYERVARVLAAAQRAGVLGIGFVTEPTP